jgi:hypothetical protein
LIDDGAAAGGAQNQYQLAVAVEHHGRRHGAARPLAGFDAVGHRLPFLLRDEGKIGELVVQQETAHHLLAAEGELDGRGHGDSVARAIDDREMAGRDQLRRRVIGKFSQRRAGRRTGLGVA